MIHILTESTDTCIGFEISDKVIAEDYEKLLPILDEEIDGGDKK